MKKTMIGSVALAAIVALAFVLAPRAEARQGNRVVPPLAPAPFLPLEGPGSSIGISVRDQLAADAAGVLIESVMDGTPATRAGLQKGDIVLEFDGERTRSARQFIRLVRETPPGRIVKMTVMRNGSQRTIDITPEARGSEALQTFPRLSVDVDRALRAIPREFDFTLEAPFGGDGPFGFPRRLGLMVMPMSDQLAGVLRREGRRAGVCGHGQYSCRGGGPEGRRRCDRGKRPRRRLRLGPEPRSARGRARIERRYSCDERPQRDRGEGDDARAR